MTESVPTLSSHGIKRVVQKCRKKGEVYRSPSRKLLDYIIHQHPSGITETLWRTTQKVERSCQPWTSYQPSVISCSNGGSPYQLCKGQSGRRLSYLITSARHILPLNASLRHPLEKQSRNVCIESGYRTYSGAKKMLVFGQLYSIPNPCIAYV